MSPAGRIAQVVFYSTHSDRCSREPVLVKGVWCLSVPRCGVLVLSFLGKLVFRAVPVIFVFLLERWVWKKKERSLGNYEVLVGCCGKSRSLRNEFVSSAQNCQFTGREIQHRIPLSSPCSLGGGYFCYRTACRLVTMAFYFLVSGHGFFSSLLSLSGVLPLTQPSERDWAEILNPRGCWTYSAVDRQRRYVKMKGI